MKDMNIKVIKNKEEYLELFKIVEKANNDTIKEALKVALDTRKFEIDLYWKRATYFWAFIAASFTAFFLLLTAKNINQFKGFTILVAVIGLLFSLGWYFVNRGSKMWQENWERHVAYLEEEVYGPLFSYVKIPDSNFWYLMQGFPFSVSKVNQLLSLVVVIFWIIAFVFSVFFSLDKLYYINDKINKKTWIIITIISSMILCIVLFKKLSHSFLFRDKINLPKGSHGLFMKR